MSNFTEEQALHLIKWLQNLSVKDFFLKSPEDHLKLYQEENTIAIPVPVQCIHCKYKHIQSERLEKTHGALTTYHCPRCSGQGYQYN